MTTQYRYRAVRRLPITLAVAGCLGLLFENSSALSQDQSPQEKLEIIKECNQARAPEIIEDSITLKKTASLKPRVLTVVAKDGFTFCVDSQVELNCTAGTCWVSFNTGEYGHDPIGCSKVRIGNKIWSWCGGLPDRIAKQMWPYLRDNVEVATQIARWPRQMSNFRETLKHVNRDKIYVHNASLGR